MKKKRNIALAIFLSILAIGITASVIFRILQDPNAYTVTEKKYIVDNKSNLISIKVLNDSNVFGRDGEGVFYDFLDNFETENSLSFDIVTNSVNDDIQGLALKKGIEKPEGSTLFFTDHYVLVGKTYTSLANLSEVSGTIGYLNKDEKALKSYLGTYSMTLKNFENKSGLLESLKKDEVSYIIVPRLEYLDIILDNLYMISLHLSDMKDYYYLNTAENEILCSILKKSFNRWQAENFENSFNKNEYNLFTNKLKITQKEIDVINKKKYRYGFMTNEPYDIKRGGVYGGIISKYIEDFSKFSGITFEYDEYSKFDKFTRAISKGEVDLFLNYYSISTSMETIISPYTIDISIVMANKDERVFGSVKSIEKEKVYVKENSLISSYLQSNGIEIETYKSNKDLKNIFKKNGIVAMDYANYLVYKDENSDVNERFRINTKSTLNFQSNNDTMFNRLFTYYINSVDKNEMLYTGIDDYNRSLTSGSLIYKITKYAIILILAIGFIIFITYKVGKRAFARKKIKRSDKMKYMDILTSLKNRNYLNENIPIWNQNTIYPQAVVIIDLNGIQEINDIYGYKEGDKQIQAAANVLIKTQLDNSEVMRTDGNEFTIYLVGYNEKQVISYIKKLNKEFKNLPYDKEAAVGFSIIEDDLKLLGDAINEATEKMKENKQLALEEGDDGKI